VDNPPPAERTRIIPVCTIIVTTRSVLDRKPSGLGTPTVRESSDGVEVRVTIVRHWMHVTRSKVVPIFIYEVHLQVPGDGLYFRSMPHSWPVAKFTCPGILFGVVSKDLPVIALP
jgi:hypothetical protein